MRDIPAADGRTLRIHEAGAQDGPLVLVQQGTPMSGLLFGSHARDAEQRGIRLVAYDRPGYGGSTPAPGRSVADAAADAPAIADALEADRFAVWGISGGGPHALACAALLPDRVVAAAALGSIAPYEADGLDWYAGMGETNLREFGAAAAGKEALEDYLRPTHRESVTADGLREGLRSLLSDVDAAVLTGEIGTYLAASMNDAARQGTIGWRDDDLAFVAPWGFSLADIRVPVQVWHGEHDRFVPFAHGEWLVANIRGVDAQLHAEDGHLTLMQRRIPEAHAWLLEHF